MAIKAFIMHNLQYIRTYIVWVPKKREEHRLEAAQMEFLRHLLGITKLDKEKNQ
jgi:predicted metal-dependent hydrolase